MLWQLTDKWRWKLIGEYALIPLHGRATEGQPRLSPYAAQKFLAYWDWSSETSNPVASQPPASNARLVKQLRTYVRRNRVTAIVFEPFGGNPSLVKSVLERAFGPGTEYGRVELWLDVPREEEALRAP